MTQDYCGWKYGYDRQNDDFIVIPSQKIERPKSFFKYYGLSDNSVDALRNLYVYASHPAQLNDLFDCDMSLVKISLDEDARYLLDGLYEAARSIYSEDDQFYIFASKIFSTIEFAKLGILSMTDSYTNPLLWAHYTQNKGFCLEWDISKFPFAYYGPFPVHYVEKVIEASSKKYGVDTLAVIQSNVKNKCWSCEKEWRLLIKNPVGIDMRTFGDYSDKINKAFPDMHDRKFKYPLSALKSVILGVDFFRDRTDNDKFMIVGNSEIHVCYEEPCYQTQILDFLDRIFQCSDTTIRWRYKNGLTIGEWDIKVVKVNNLTYRIIEIQ